MDFQSSEDQIRHWYNSLEEKEQADLNNLLSLNVYGYFLDYVRKEHGEFYEQLERYCEELRDKAKRHYKLTKEIGSHYSSEAFDIFCKIEKIILADLQIFFDAQIFRELQSSKIREITDAVIRNVFVDRKFSAVHDHYQELGIDSQDSAWKIYGIIEFLLDSYCNLEMSIEDLENLLTEELELCADRAYAITGVLAVYRDSIERFFILRNLSSLLARLDSLETSVSYIRSMMSSEN